MFRLVLTEVNPLILLKIGAFREVEDIPASSLGGEAMLGAYRAIHSFEKGTEGKCCLLASPSFFLFSSIAHDAPPIHRGPTNIAAQGAVGGGAQQLYQCCSRDRLCSRAEVHGGEIPVGSM